MEAARTAREARGFKQTNRLRDETTLAEEQR